jgi:nucleoside-diphosphate-sugar epimerase
VRIIILGGAGYIGTRLSRYLHNLGHMVTTVDRWWFDHVPVMGVNEFCLDYRDLWKTDLLGRQDAIILLAGHTSAAMCPSGPDAFLNNVQNFVAFLEEVKLSQRFIYASDSMIYGNTDFIPAIESHQALASDQYSISKVIIDQYAKMSGFDYYGLRLGSVNGFSSHLRIDLPINAMAESVKRDGTIRLTDRYSWTPILGMNDLCRAIKTILDCPSWPGIYNLASFCSTNEVIAEGVKVVMGGQVIHMPDEAKLSSTISTDKFKARFEFRFEDTIDSIVKELGSEAKIKTDRTQVKSYRHGLR